MSATSTTQPCEALWQSNELVLRNTLFAETWCATEDGRLRLVSFRRADGPEWISPRIPSAPAPGEAPVGAPPASTPAGTGAWTPAFATHSTASTLTAEIRFTAGDGAHRLHTFKLHPLVAGSVHRITGPETDATLRELEDPSITEKNIRLTGRIFIKPNGHAFITPPEIAYPLFGLSRRHLAVRDVAFVDQTDHHGNLVFEREYLLQPAERCLPLRTNLVCVEDTASRDGEGFLWLMLAPLHHVREKWSPVFDFLFAFQQCALTATACPAGYALARVAYTGGRAGATLALQSVQRAFYQAGGEQPGLLLSNTWGDRCGAKSLSEQFVLDEIAAARDLGVEVVQIDDGWQKGATVNTPVAGNTGVWNGFWAADPDFWTPNTTRFPRGLAPLIAAASTAGVRLGLWYAPDSTNDLANWERDAAQILQLWREHGIAFFKLDAVKIHSRLAETRFHALCDRAQSGSRGKILFDFDATAEHRPTFWGRPGGGELFLENRFTDETNYYPHATLRALWTLAHHVRAKRIRLEFLNPARNDALYGEDPLRPAAYPAEYLFAITMPCAPLAWFELSKLSPPIASRWKPLIATWKAHRDPFQNGDVFPVGATPDGFSWTGFVSYSNKTLYALIFRELTPDTNATIAIPRPATIAHPAATTPEILAGEGKAVLESNGTRISVQLPATQRFVLARWALG